MKQTNKQEDWKDKIKDICWQLVDVDRDYQYSPSSIKEAIQEAISKTEEHVRKAFGKELSEAYFKEIRQETAKKIFDRLENTVIGYSRALRQCKKDCEHKTCNDWKKLKKEFVENGK